MAEVDSDDDNAAILVLIPHSPFQETAMASIAVVVDAAEAECETVGSSAVDYKVLFSLVLPICMN